MRSEIVTQYRAIAAFYNHLYVDSDDCWSRLARRGRDFDAFVASLVCLEKTRRYLDVGCGEGFLLSVAAAPDKWGVDISSTALRKATGRSGATLCLSIGEELPFRDGSFDCVTSIGVMTHFVDDIKATAEIRRILRTGGRYIVGIFVRSSFLERSVAKLAEFWYPHPRLLDFLQWLWRDTLRRNPLSRRAARHPRLHQPVERRYTPKVLMQLFETAGFELVELITKLRRPNIPLAGQHFRIYVLRKR